MSEERREAEGEREEKKREDSSFQNYGGKKYLSFPPPKPD